MISSNRNRLPVPVMPVGACLVAEAVKKLCASGFRDIEFVDNVFNSPHEHALAVCEEISRTPGGPGGKESSTP
ncbi:MAG: hypothetical protein M0Z48_10570 [Nitrospiraceae bacterium]|nr:hypothetical protein [Nitrospiraceae bacterium]